MKSSMKDLISRSDEAWSIKSQWVSLYDEAYTLALPQRNTFETLTPGAKKTEKVYDSTLQSCTIKLAGTLQSNITPPFTKWAKLVPGVFISDEDRRDWTEYLSTVTDIIFAGMQPSSFDVACGEFFLDLIIGTGAMLVLEGDYISPFKFITVPISEIALEEGPDSDIGAVFRRFKKPLRTIRKMWSDIGKNNALDDMIKDTGEESDVDLNEITYYDYEDNFWRYMVFIDSGPSEGGGTGYKGQQSEDGTGALLLVERTYRISPWIIARWVKVSGEIFGRGPVLNALPDAKTINLAKRLELQNASLAVAGVWLVKNNGVINPNTITIKPGSIIPVMSTGGSQGADLQPLQMGNQLTYSQIVIKDLTESIKEAMFDRSIPVQGAVRSATEWMVRQRMLQEAIGAPFGRMHQEFIRPLFRRMLDILQRKAYIDESISLDGSNIDVQIVGSLAQTQALKEVETISNWGAMSRDLAGQEGFMMAAKTESIPKKLAELLGVDVELLRTEEEKKQFLEVLMSQVQGSSSEETQ